MARSSLVHCLTSAAALACFVTAGACAADDKSTNKSETRSGVTKAAPAPPKRETPPPAAVKKSPEKTDPAPVANRQPAPVTPVQLGHDFIKEAKTLFRAAVCRGNAALPARVRKRFMRRHCRYLNTRIERYKKNWLSKARPFFDKLVPKTVDTKTIVYPFGGGDLMTALAVFPNLTEVTTLSLEPSGDPRTINTISGATFERYWGRVHRFLASLLIANHSRTIDMIAAMNFGKLPGEVIFSLFALAIHDMEPVSLRYFALQPDGRVKYFTTADITAADKAIADAKGRRARRKARRARIALFRNMELQFRKGSGPVKIHRHIRENLGNKHLKKDRRVINHLELKGRVPAMTKAASYLLWNNSFSIIRSYLIKNLVWMVSDATGIPPRVARKHGLEQITYGRFITHIPTMPNPGRSTIRDFVRLWKRNPKRRLRFRFGYAGGFQWGLHHLMVTRPKN